MSPPVLFLIFLVFVAIFGFYLGFWHERKKVPQVKKKKKNHPD